jgi:predicted acylesterase/phospholipase RssA/CRP-like cAMP-binding protein
MDVDGEARTALTKVGTRRVLADSEVLVRRGEQSEHVFLVDVGVLDVIVGDDTHLTSVGPGSIVGEVAALSGTERTAMLRSRGTTDVVVIERAAFEAWLGDHPEESARVAAAARRRLHEAQLIEIAASLLGAESAAALAPDVLAAVSWRDLPAGTTLFNEGDPPDAAHFVVEGRLDVTRRAADGSTLSIGSIGRGEAVGEAAIMLRSTRTATVVAARDTTLASVDVTAFESMLASHPALTLQVARRMVERASGIRPPKRRATVVALVVTPQAARTWRVSPSFDDAVADEVGRWGSTFVTSSASIDSALGRDGIAQVRADDVRATRVAQHLAELEVAHDHVVHVIGSEPDEWARRALQRADRIVMVASARPDAAEIAQLDAQLDLVAGNSVPRWLVLVQTARDRPVAGSGLVVRRRFDELHHVSAGSASDAGRIARLSVGAGFGLVLGGGGARGFAHLGVLRALREQQVPVDRVIGASMGSIFAAGIATYRDLAELESVCAAQFDRLLDYTVPVVALLKAKRITANLERVFGGLDAEDLWLPFACVSTNLTRSRLEVHRGGDLVTAIRASIAIPGVLPPVPFGDDLLVDGGVLDNVPADVMRDDPSIGTVIAVDVAPDRGPSADVDYGMYVSGWQAIRNSVRRRRGAEYPGVGQVLVRTMITGSEGRRAAFRVDGTVDLYLDLEMTGVGLLEFDKFRPTVEQGYRLSSPRIAAWLAERGPHA